MNITYRKANLADIPALARLRIEFLKEVQNPDTYLVNEEQLNAILTDYFQQSLTNDDVAVWIALVDEEIVSTSGLCFSTIIPGFTLLDGRVAYIMNIYTLANWRKKGIGKQVFHHIVEEAKSRGYKRILLHATEDGRPIYEKFGFRATNDEMELRIE